jgi:hypothetical protein
MILGETKTAWVKFPWSAQGADVSDNSKKRGAPASRIPPGPDNSKKCRAMAAYTRHLSCYA